jgi:hypothetical protein
LWLISALRDHEMIPCEEGTRDWSGETVELTQTSSNPSRAASHSGHFRVFADGAKR